jgi:hypothetical protein
MATPTVPATATVPATPKAAKLPVSTAGFTLVSAEKMPARTVSASAKERLAAYQAEQAATRAATAAPIVTGLLDGQAITDNVVYTTAADASRVAQNAKRLVAPGLAAVDMRPSVRVTGEGMAFAWYVTAVALVITEGGTIAE